ncbi:twin-arginine translocation pathway signal [Bordetella genomosp. 9]|uniref:Twin-arginine translocation pathway signal n=1 Tax=Bordetella genomosp. 9 TaxID=1416803 RepID=A0A261RPQ0_9BORD|nr:tripartite tricarboxylate transporter substrate binding protein [Bordetella genomosp. 9]OZI26263.1 twin-arginine translocation pathway signal [Bordetella genomosp. 9]
MKLSTFLGRAVVAASMSVCATGALAADNYPSRPVRLVVGFAVGGPTDIVARVVANELGKALGQTVIVENRPGANATIAAALVARAPADGYTGLIAATNHTINAVLYRDLPFKSVDDFAPVAAVAVAPTVLVVNKDFPAKDLNEFLQVVRANPGKYSYASAGSGGTPHLSAELFKKLTHTSLVHVPYKGAAPAISDVMAGHVAMSFATLGSVLPQIKAGQVRALAVAAPQRSPLLPDVPTFAESSSEPELKQFRLDSWYGLMMPKDTPKAIVDRLASSLQGIARTPEFAAQMATAGLQPITDSTPQSFEKQLRDEVAQFADLVKSSNLKID